MTPRAALLPHESYCLRCGGEGTVPGEESYTSSTATWPRTIGSVPCPADCADGVVVNESRGSSRPEGSIGAAFIELRLAVTNAMERAVTAEHALDHANDHIDALLIENRRLRNAVEKAARTIERNHLGPSPAESSPHSNRAVGDGSNQSKEIQ